MHPLAYVRDTTGKIIRLGMFESVAGLKVEESRITLAINTAKVKQVSGGYQITQRGTTLYTFTLEASTGVWSLTSTFPVCWSTDELHGQPRPARDTEWEELCYRPGSARNPQDNTARRAQGY